MMIDKDYGRFFRLLLSLILSLIITIAVTINSGYLQFLDSLVISNIQRRQSSLTKMMYEFVSFMGGPKMGILIILLIAFFLWGFKYKIPALWCLGTLFFGNLIVKVIKEIIRRPRPIMHLPSDGGFSYPSGHTFSTFIIIGMLWLFVFPILKNQKLRLTLQFFGIIAVVLQMMSRVYLNAHYPTDTLGAALMAYTWLQFSEILYFYLTPKLLDWRFTHNSYY